MLSKELVWSCWRAEENANQHGFASVEQKKRRRAKKFKKILGAQIFDFTKENSFFENFLRNFFKNFRKKTCISKNIGI